MRSFFAFVAIAVCVISCSFSILAADNEPLAAESPSEESPSKSGEKPDVTPDAEGFYGVPDAVIDDPDGYVNLRKEKSADSPIVAKVKKDEPFEFKCTQNATWCKVKLASGLTGWMHYSRIKRYYTEKDLPKGPEDSGEEIDEQTRKHGVNYYEVTRAAAHGDKKALKTFFTLDLDGAAAETHITSIMEVVIHLVGDDKFAAFLREQPPEFRQGISGGWELGTFSPFDPKEYFRQHFPKSAKILFPDYHQQIRDYIRAIERKKSIQSAIRDEMAQLDFRCAVPDCVWTQSAPAGVCANGGGYLAPKDDSELPAGVGTGIHRQATCAHMVACVVRRPGFDDR